jgi:peptide/nickel transport system substrate-binding protein
MKSLLLRSAVALGTLFAVHAAAYADPVMGGTLRFARNTDSEILDPVLNNANADIWILTNLYSTLILPAPDGKGLLPGLATKWSSSADGKTYTLTLRSGAKFADGSPVTTDDVVWSLNRARNPEFSARLHRRRDGAGRPYHRRRLEEPRPLDPGGARDLQLGDHAA